MPGFDSTNQSGLSEIDKLVEALLAAYPVGRAAVQKWGEETQKMMAMEELAELLVVLAREPRGRVGEQEIQSEIADVLIMATQLALIYGMPEVAKMVAMKTSRLSGYI